MKQVAAQNQVSDDTIITFDLQASLRPFKGFSKNHSAFNRLSFFKELKRYLNSGAISRGVGVAQNFLESLGTQRLLELDKYFASPDALPDLMLCSIALAALEQNRMRISYTQEQNLGYMLALHLMVILLGEQEAFALKIDRLPPIHAFDPSTLDKSLIAHMDARNARIGGEGNV